MSDSNKKRDFDLLEPMYELREYVAETKTNGQTE